LRNGLRGFKQGFTCPALLRCLLRVRIAFVYAPVTLYGSPFQRIRLTTGLVTLLLQVLQPPRHRNATGLGCSDFARHYFRNRGFFLFLQVLRWFTSLSSLDPAYVFSGSYMRFAHVGFPIRKSPDITPVCGSPKLIAACHVLHRLYLPRHPPCALSSLTIELTPRRSRFYVVAAVMRFFQTAEENAKDYSKDTQLTNFPISWYEPRTRSLLSLVIYLPNRFRCQTSRHGLSDPCSPSGELNQT
jgi:hypothetical protein